MSVQHLFNLITALHLTIGIGSVTTDMKLCKLIPFTSWLKRSWVLPRRRRISPPPVTDWRLSNTNRPCCWTTLAPREKHHSSSGWVYGCLFTKYSSHFMNNFISVRNTFYIKKYKNEWMNELIPPWLSHRVTLGASWSHRPLDCWTQVHV